MNTMDLMTSWPPQNLAVVIGAGGMGMAVARRLGQHHRVLLADMNAARLDNRVARLREEGVRALGQPCDITDPAAVAGLAERVREQGGFAVLAHVTGLSPSMASWRDIVAVNLIGPTLVTEALFPLVTEGTSAVLVASLSAYLAEPDDRVVSLLANPLADDFFAQLDSVHSGGMTPQLGYMLSKFALIRLARRLAVDWGEKGGRVMSISPGLIATPQGTNEFRHSTSKHRLLSQCPLRRQGGMQEIADAVEFLTSARATYINGIDLLVDGGLQARLSEHKSPRQKRDES